MSHPAPSALPPQSRPLRIGMSACFFHADKERPIFKGKTLLYLEESMARWLMRHHVLPWMLPRVPDHATVRIDDFIADIDGLVLQGGSDVSPHSYGEMPLRPEWAGDKPRDDYEITLLRACMDANKPVLGVCRGLQLINVALGGTLYQDINAQVPKSERHRDWHMYDQNQHTVQLVEGTRLAAMYQSTHARIVNSVHHQAIKDLAPGLMVEAKSPRDSVIEAVRYTGKPYVFGVQWHPEFQHDDDHALLPAEPILVDFLEAVNMRKQIQI